MSPVGINPSDTDFGRRTRSLIQFRSNSATRRLFSFFASVRVINVNCCLWNHLPVVLMSYCTLSVAQTKVVFMSLSLRRTNAVLSPIAFRVFSLTSFEGVWIGDCASRSEDRSLLSEEPGKGMAGFQWSLNSRC